MKSQSTLDAEALRFYNTSPSPTNYNDSTQTRDALIWPQQRAASATTSARTSVAQDVAAQPQARWCFKRYDTPDGLDERPFKSYNSAQAVSQQDGAAVRGAMASVSSEEMSRIVLDETARAMRRRPGPLCQPSDLPAPEPNTPFAVEVSTFQQSPRKMKGEEDCRYFFEPFAGRQTTASSHHQHKKSDTSRFFGSEGVAPGVIKDDEQVKPYNSFR